MTVAMTENASLVGMDAQQKAERVPEQYFEAITGSASSLDPALIFTQDNLLAIKRYASVVRRLPPDRESLQRSMNFVLLEIDPEAIHQFYEDLRRHVAGWNVLEQETKTLGTQLDNFATNFTSDGQALLSAIRDSEAIRSAGLLRELDEQLLDHLQAQRLEPMERAQVISSIEDYLAVITEDVSLAIERITAVEARANRFARDVVDILRPKAEGLLRGFKGKADAEKLDEMNQQLLRLDQLITEKTEAYKSLVGYTLAGLLFGPVGVAITGGIYGSQAESVRKEKNQYIEQRKGLAEAVEELEPEIGRFQLTMTLLRDLELRLVEVETAAKNLEDVWNTLSVYAEESHLDLKRIDTDISLARFAMRFERVIRPWKSIRSKSHQLSEVFNEVVDRYVEEN
ncbi:alpha-xenorhabdolysin family binary toxin subunit A [Pseudomonas putida]|uniref:alpha-xenorhabdolysin family binary toxin subunit A n=1 Tax=Pseudomonas putida TaxID=303 RepID=UPI002365DC8D|nr:alpha-xenorhabdolysin family binary toxin subunit A [Pseudomonas putida]MDD2047862.1 alpha-xenorhabdolysin family binary toxin subunit A [Pseudomonas putida]